MCLHEFTQFSPKPIHPTANDENPVLQNGPQMFHLRVVEKIVKE